MREFAKKIEPNVSTTAERFEVLKQMREAGIPTVVWLTTLKKKTQVNNLVFGI